MQKIFLQNPASPEIGISGKAGGREERRWVLSYSEHNLDQLAPKIGQLEAKSVRALSLFFDIRGEKVERAFVILAIGLIFQFSKHGDPLFTTGENNDLLVSK